MIILKIVKVKRRNMNPNIKTVGIVGTGFMGRQIANWAALHNYTIHMYDIDSEVLEDAKVFITKALKRKHKENIITNIKYFNSLESALQNVELVIEAISEDLSIKKEVFSQIENCASADTIIATNSSSFPVSKIEDSVQKKDRVLNLHFYAPINVRPMVDIMRGTQTSDEVFERGKKWIESIECTPLVLKKHSFGFLFNRIWRAVKRECLSMWADGIADIENIDEAWRIFTSMPMGPFTMMDGIGLDVIYNVESSYFQESNDPKDKPPEKLKLMVERGELGLKSGKGFYQYKKGKK
jgi:3-hydroxybutyryl-CoA dehydrogenase